MSRRRLAVRSLLLSSLALGVTLGVTSPVVAATSGVARTAVVASAAEVAPARGTLDGQLVDEQDQSVGGIRAELFLLSNSGPMDAPVAISFSSTSAQWDQDHLDPGSYRFKDVEPGDYVLRFVDDAENYAPSDYADGATVTVAPGVQELGKSVLQQAEPRPTATVTGLLLHPDGAPVAFSYVELVRVIRGTRTRALHGAGSDESGRVTITRGPHRRRAHRLRLRPRPLRLPGWGHGSSRGGDLHPRRQRHRARLRHPAVRP